MRLLAVSTLLPAAVSAMRYGLHEAHYAPSDADLGTPLILTDLLDDPAAAREAAKVDLSGPAGAHVGEDLSFDSYSGFFRIDEEFDKTLYAWYVPATSADASEDAPTIMWLQGGPGGASTYGAWAENIGPTWFDTDGAVRRTPDAWAWSTDHNMLFVDQPVGTGWSFTNGEDGSYATSEGDVATDLYAMLQQFFTMFPDLLERDFYVCGESYAGKYVPAISYAIDAQNQKIAAGELEALTLPLAGLCMGDGWSDPYNMVPEYKGLLLGAGLIDDSEAEVVQEYQDGIIAALDEGDNYGAFLLWDTLINGDECECTPYVQKATGLDNYFNFLQDLIDETPQLPRGNYVGFLTSDEGRRMFHVGNATYGGAPVEEYLVNDIMTSMMPQMPQLVSNYKVLIYNGQLDVIVGAPLGNAFANAIPWAGQSQFNAVAKTIWHDANSTDVSGYVRNVDTLTQIVVRGAGHMAPLSQSARVNDMLRRWITDAGFD